MLSEQKYVDMSKFKFIVIGLSGLCMMCCSCNREENVQHQSPMVRLFVTGEENSENVSVIFGRVKARKEVNMAFKVDGTLKKFYVQEGRRVKKGGLIAELDNRDYLLQLEANRAEYHGIKSEAERVIALYEENVTTTADYDKARYGLQQITAKYQHALNQLQDTKLYAPFDGFVQKKLVLPPTVVAAGMPIVSFVSDDACEIEGYIPNSVYAEKDKIKAFLASFDNLEEKRIETELVSISPDVNANQLHTIRLKVHESVKPKPVLGMSSKIEIVFEDQTEQKVQVPASALFEKDGKSYVWIYGNDEKLQQRQVSVERLTTNSMAIISSGIQKGEKVVAAGVHRLKNGQKVRVMQPANKTNVGGLL